jgi:hypothetical protein
LFGLNVNEYSTHGKLGLLLVMMISVGLVVKPLTFKRVVQNFKTNPHPSIRGTQELGLLMLWAKQDLKGSFFRLTSSNPQQPQSQGLLTIIYHLLRGLSISNGWFSSAGKASIGR